MTRLETGLVFDPPEVLRIQGTPYYQHWRCPSCRNFQVVTADPNGPPAYIEDRATDHLTTCVA